MGGGCLTLDKKMQGKVTSKKNYLQFDLSCLLNAKYSKFAVIVESRMVGLPLSLDNKSGIFKDRNICDLYGIVFFCLTSISFLRLASSEFIGQLLIFDAHKL